VRVVITWLAAALLPLCAACTSSASADHVEVHGSFADGSPIDARVVPNVAVVTSLQPQIGTVLAVGAPVSGPRDLLGFRIEWVQTAISVGASFPSSPDGPVVFYVIRMQPDGGAMDQEASVVNGGTITFTDDRRKTSGTLANLVLSRNGTTILTVDNGTFEATKP
jgi:hypothetical protein